MRATTLLTAASAPTAMVAHHQATTQQRFPWHSPVPYLFGGLAAMLGLIAFALLLLACSYWRLSGYLEGGNNGGDDPESGEGKPGDAGDSKPPPHPLEQRIVVIMAGDCKPSFLATPTTSRASSFANDTNKGEGGYEASETGDEKKAEAEAGGDAESHSHHHQQGSHENQEQTEAPQEQNLEESRQSLQRLQ